MLTMPPAPFQTSLFANAAAAPISTAELLAQALALLGDAAHESLTAPERAIADAVSPIGAVGSVGELRAAIESGGDPLGDAWCRIYAPNARRARGQTFTPQRLVDAMVERSALHGVAPERVVDPGAGSGRFATAALRRFPAARAVAIEQDPALAILLRAQLHVAGVAERTQVIVGDFRTLQLPRCSGPTLFIGNPPYVRHHDIAAEWKQWYSATLCRLGARGSQLAGLHLHFYAQTLTLAQPGDLGCYVTSAEWLDTGYGRALRQMLTDGLGGLEVHALDPAEQVFDDALVSAAVVVFAPGKGREELRFGRPQSAGDLPANAGVAVPTQAARAASRWSPWIRPSPPPIDDDGLIELGELCRVSRGQVTGANRVWIASAQAPSVPARFAHPSITDACDITGAPGAVIDRLDRLRRVIDLPADLAVLSSAEREQVDMFIDWARRQGADRSYVARHRRAWWSVGLKPPAPVVMTYMGRRPPVFALNLAGARLINVAHELVPRQALSTDVLRALVEWLNQHPQRGQGRTYAGGLTKFEPSEAMRLRVPQPSILAAPASAADMA